MATGPFQVNPNSAQEIQRVQQQGGFDTLVPASHSVGDAAAVLGTVAKVIEGVEKDKAQEALRGKLGAVTRALQASKFPDAPEGELVTQEGLANPMNQGAIKEMQRIVNAGMQGKLPQYAVVERVNVILNDAVSAAPEWRDELNQVAREMLGFNPQAELMSQLLAAPRAGSGGKTERDKLQERADALGIPFETLQSIELQGVQAEAERLQLSLARDRGEYGAAEATRESYLAAGNVAQTAIGWLQERIRAGQGINADEYKSVLANAKEQEKQRLLQNLGPGTSVTTINAAMGQLDKVFSGLESMADNQDALAVLTKHNKTFVQMTTKDVYAIQGIGQVLAIAGPGGFEAVLAATERYGNNPTGLKMFMQSGQPGSGTMNMAVFFKGMVESLERQAGGVPPANDEQRRLDMVTMQAVLQQKGLTGAKAAPYLSWLRQAGKDTKGGDFGSINSLSDNKVVSNLSKVKEAHPELINLFNSEWSRLILEYDGLAQQGLVPKGGVQADGATLAPAPFVSQKDDNGASAQYNTWIRRVNNLINFADKYRSTGVFPDSMYQGAGWMATQLNGREKPGITSTGGTTPAAPQAAVRFVRDANGKLTRFTEGGAE